jgi:hypothetical protein
LIVTGLALAAFGGLSRAADKPAAPPAAPAPAPVFVPLQPQSTVATVGGEKITFGDMQRALVEAYGMKVLVPQIMLVVAEQEAKKAGITVGDADVAAELIKTEKAAFPESVEADYPQLLDQLLNKQGMGRAEFDLVLRTNLILRRIAEPQVKRQLEQLTDAKLLEYFNARYGETAVVRHIQLTNPIQAALAKNRLAAGEKFENVVRAMSQNRVTAVVDGELPKFSRQTDNWGGEYGKVPQAFKDFAFAPSAKEGDVSDIIRVDTATGEGTYHVLKLDRKIAPKIVKFDDAMKASIKAEIEENAVRDAIKALRGRLVEISRASLKIEEPTLAKQYQDILEEQKKQQQTKAQDAERARQDALKGKAPSPTSLRNYAEPGSEAPKDQQGTVGTPGGAAARGASVASPANAPAGERPPASKSAAPGAADVK